MNSFSFALTLFAVTIPVSVSAAIVFEEVDVILPDEQIQESPLELEELYREFDCSAKQANQSQSDDITSITDSNTPQIEPSEPCLW